MRSLDVFGLLFLNTVTAYFDIVGEPTLTCVAGAGLSEGYAVIITDWKNVYYIGPGLLLACLLLVMFVAACLLLHAYDTTNCIWGAYFGIRQLSVICC